MLTCPGAAAGAGAIRAASVTGAANVTGAASAAGAAGDFRAVWVCSVLNLDFPSKTGLGNAELKSEIDAIIKNTAAMNLNAIILQVRPCGDALYKSSLFPWSEFLSGVQGVAPADGFDPLEYWIEQAHANGLELHAWINPYRVTHTSANVTDTGMLANGNPAKTNPARIVAYKDALYYDPGIYENKKLVVAGVVEIVNNYDVDGIHLDDYFYPGTDFPDDATYAKHGSGIDKADWRRGNVNDIIKGIQRAINREEKKLGKHIRFGVAPFSIWMNASSSPLGSNTRGNEAYKAMYADTRRWAKSGWVDYICPQIYWYRGFEIADYEIILDWWADVCEGTPVDLYIGHAAYREFERESGGGDANWSGEIVGQLELNAGKYPGLVKGSVFFRYGSLRGELGRQIASFYG
ncbi:MAG: family 10 glycosylhydrolase [Oscillospiraceae bacterium]|nr:family 10 glycosylhydrolase [Oscillospiraceae bacterium]